MLKILSPGSGVVRVPHTLNDVTMHGFIRQAINEAGDARFATTHINFESLQQIDPVGVVVLSNLIEYLRRAGVSGTLTKHYVGTRPINYLDNIGFFARYNGQPLNRVSSVQTDQLPLTLVNGPAAIGFLYFQLVPWIASRIGVSEMALAPFRAGLEEIFHNINDHSGVNVGCVFAEYFPEKLELQVIVSDFGHGIPFNVRKVEPQIGDSAALLLASKEGFTTRSNVRNRGAGLPNLIRAVTMQDRGTIAIDSGRGHLVAAFVPGVGSVLRQRTRQFVYPGTLVRVTLKAGSVSDMEKAIQLEEFSW